MKLTITIEGLVEVLREAFNPNGRGRSVMEEADVAVTTETPNLTRPGADVAPAPPITVRTESAVATTLAPAPEPTHAPGATVAGPPTGQIELDANNLPWDNRINTASRGKTAKGVWKKRPGLADGVYETVLAELAGAQAAPAPVTEQEAPAPAAFVPPVADAPAPGAITTYAELNAVLMTGVKTIEEVTAACISCGLQSYSLLAGRPDLIPSVVAALGL